MFIRVGETDVDLIIQGVSQRELDALTRRATLVVHRDVNMVRGLDRVEGHAGKSLPLRQGNGWRLNEDQVRMGRSVRNGAKDQTPALRPTLKLPSAWVPK